MHRPDSGNTVCRGGTLRLPIWVFVALLAGWHLPSQAQWITQNTRLRPGWNSVYLHVDASHTHANSLLIQYPSIQEVWMWTADAPPGLTLATPPDPTSESSRWMKWTQIEGPSSVLSNLVGNAALLVKVADGAAPFDWSLKGRPVAPLDRWTLSGLNFVGFPTVSPISPNFETFLTPDAQTLDWKQSAEIFRYVGGALGATNPVSVPAILQRNVPVVREQAYWIRTGEPTNQIYNHYFGPFKVMGSGATGIHFGDDLGQTRLILKNMTGDSLTVTLQFVNSEAPPSGPDPQPLPLMVRGPINTTNLTFGFSSLLDGPRQWTLAAHGQPGSEVEIVLGIDRSLMGTEGGTPFAGVLRFTDALGLTRVDIGASAETSSRAGLWVGNAVVDQVSLYLKRYLTATNASHFHQRLNELGFTVGGSSNRYATSVDGLLRYEWDPGTRRVLVFGTNASNGKVFKGSYVPDGIITTNDYVARPASLRLIVHLDGTNSVLMQRAFLGLDAASELIVARTQFAFPPEEWAHVRRISAVHLPVAEDNHGPWPMVEQGGDLWATVDVRFDDQASNPFLHTYHPDHDNIDNRDDTFETPLGAGRESYDIQRILRLHTEEPGLDFDSRTRGGTRMGGQYLETVALRAKGQTLRSYNVLGAFTLTRITDAPLIQP